MEKKKDRTWIWKAIISGLFTVIVAIISIQPWKHTIEPINSPTCILSGIVVDEMTNAPIAGASISVVGRNEQYFSEGNGNFDISFKDSLSQVRIRILKKGYSIYDQSFDIPSTGVIIQLKHNR